ncbi:hypothetical protein BT69DRAFT_1294332 [Atractiella rhizophila]|nr:hypothetical protein BT69DRAFT_1294332 [Atractiella rhizophila]
MRNLRLQGFLKPDPSVEQMRSPAFHINSALPPSGARDQSLLRLWYRVKSEDFNLPSRDTGRFFDVAYKDHLKGELEALRHFDFAPFHDQITVTGLAAASDQGAAFIDDLRHLLPYIHPSQCLGPVQIQIDRSPASAPSAPALQVVRILREDRCMMTIVLLPHGVLCEQDWAEFNKTDFDDLGNTVSGQYLSVLADIMASEPLESTAVLCDMHSSVTLRLNYTIRYAFHLQEPYLPLMALLSVSGCRRDPSAGLQTDLTAISKSSEFDLFDVQAAGYTFQQAIISWHHARLQEGKLWLDDLRLPGEDLPVVSILKNIMLHAMSKQRSSLPAIDLKIGESIQLLRSLRSGPQLWGQVYEVTIPGRELSGTCLVLKIYEERLYPFPAWNGAGEEASKRIRRWPDAQDCLIREQSAYTSLQLLQGSAISRSYGFYEVRLSDGTVAPAHLLEFVEGPHIDKAGLKSLSADDQRAFYINAMTMIGAVLLLGVNHTDIDQRPDQIICHSDGSGVPNPVFLDFGMSNCGIFMDDSALNSKDLAWDLEVLGTPDSLHMTWELCDYLGWDDISEHPEGVSTYVWKWMKTVKFGSFDVKW